MGQGHECANPDRDPEGGETVKHLSKEDRAQWRNVWCVLRSLDSHEIEPDRIIKVVDWRFFCLDPHAYLIRANDRQADAIWTAVEKRLK